MIRTLKHDLLAYLDLHPRLFRIQMALRASGSLAVDTDTDVVIEGYPRSGNTFAVASFELAQPGPVRIARHLHSPAQLATAVRLAIPALVVVRALPDPVLSMVIRHPEVDLGRALRDYANFHESLARVKHRVVLAPFEEVTTNFGSAVARLNDRFGTTFALPPSGEEFERAVFQRVEQMERCDSGAADLREAAVARPSEQRSARKEALLRAYMAPKLAGARRRAKDALAEVLAG